jgi:heme-binding protein
MFSLWGFTSSGPRWATAFALTAAGGLGAVALSAATGLGGPSGLSTPSATAAPDPCAASEVAKTVAMVATHTGNYLEANPKANQAITTISQQQDGPASIAALKAYFDANPQVAGDMQRLQQPLAALSGTCKLPVTLPQVFGLMQAAQQPPATRVSPAAADPGRLPPTPAGTR